MLSLMAERVVKFCACNNTLEVRRVNMTDDRKNSFAALTEVRCAAESIKSHTYLLANGTPSQRAVDLL